MTTIRDLGIDTYLMKPVRQAELREAISAALSHTDPAPPKPAQAPFPETTRGLTILLTDDNTVNQKIASRALEKRGYYVVVANHGIEALAALEQQAFDIVLMDVQMPEMDGFQATAAIRKRNSLPVSIFRSSPSLRMP